MENASKALIIAGAILLSILIIAIGMYIYTSSHNSISEAGSQISEQEKTSFNQQWNTYEGAQGGNNVRALLQKIIGNCNTNAQEAQRLVDVAYTRAASNDTGNNAYQNIGINVTNATTADADGAVPRLNALRNRIEARHTYYITIEYSPSTSLVNRIVIQYEKDDPLDTIDDADNG